MEYRIYEEERNQYVLQVAVPYRDFFMKKVGWAHLRADGKICKPGQEYICFKNLDKAREFYKWLISNRVHSVHEEETFSAPATVVMDGVSIPATANFRIDRVDTPPEDYKGDVVEVSVVEEPEEEVGTPSPSENFGFAPARKARGKYDRDELEADIRDGVLTSSQLLDKHSISAPTLSKVRKEMGYGRTKKDKPAPKKKEASVVVDIENPAINLDAEIKLLFVRGFKVQEVSDMYPMVPLDRIIRLKGDVER